MVLIGAGTVSLVALAIGLVVFDAGVQGTHISNQTIVYALRPEARSRLNSAYMTAYFLGGAAGSGLSAAVYAGYGWLGVSVLAAAFPAAGWCAWLVDTSGVPVHPVERERRLRGQQLEICSPTEPRSARPAAAPAP